jgi:hypothetical protein
MPNLPIASPVCKCGCCQVCRRASQPTRAELAAAIAGELEELASVIEHYALHPDDARARREIERHLADYHNQTTLRFYFGSELRRLLNPACDYCHEELDPDAGNVCGIEACPAFCTSRTKDREVS